jgi:hypothetical protein
MPTYGGACMLADSVLPAMKVQYGIHLVWLPCQATVWFDQCAQTRHAVMLHQHYTNLSHHTWFADLCGWRIRTLSASAWTYPRADISSRSSWHAYGFVTVLLAGASLQMFVLVFMMLVLCVYITLVLCFDFDSDRCCSIASSRWV